MQTLTDLPIPRRGVRPRNRRELALVAAAGLFHARGYPNVSMSDLADEVAMGPSALYRHFSGKQDVLRIVVVGALEVLVEQVEASSDPLPMLLARTAIDFRRCGLLFRRERSYLDQENAAVAEAHLARLRAEVSDRVAVARPDLVASSVQVLAEVLLGATWSRSYVPVDPIAEEAVDQLAATCARVLAARIPASNEPDDTTRRPQSRREELLTASVELFARHGYHAVSINDLRARTSASSTSIYQLLGSKAEILQLASTRGIEHLLLTHRTATDATQCLTALVDFVVDNPDLADVVLVESAHLDAEHGRAVQSARDAYVEEWELVLRAADPTCTREDRLIRILALLVGIAEATRSLGPDLAPRSRSALTALGAALIDAPPPPPIGDHP